jgi:hypothetical protein
MIMDQDDGKARSAGPGCERRKAIGELLRVETVSSGGRSLKSTSSSGSFIDASFGGGFSVPNAIMPPRTAITNRNQTPNENKKYVHRRHSLH